MKLILDCLRTIYKLPDHAWFNMFISLVYFTSKNRRFPIKGSGNLNDYSYWFKTSPEASNYGYFVDKDLVKSFIRNFIGEEYLIPTMAICRSGKEAARFSFPGAYVVKPTHMSGAVIFKPEGGSLTPAEVKECASWLKISQFKRTRENNYRYLEPKLIFEPLMLQDGHIPTDYKFYTIHGNVELIRIIADRHNVEQTCFYSPDWRLLDIPPFNRTNFCPAHPRPRYGQEMYRLAERVGSLFPYARIDFYQTDAGVRIGEITLTPSNGIDHHFESDFGIDMYNKILQRGTVRHLEQPAKEEVYHLISRAG